MAMGHEDRDDFFRLDDSYVSPPNIRTTGELPAVTGEIQRSDLPQSPPDAYDPSEDFGARSRRGSVVDRPPVPAPDWMSGVEVPELIVTRDIGGAVDPPVQDRVAQLAQRILGLVLLALLVAAVALVAISSIFGFR